MPSNNCKNQVATHNMVRQETANALKLFLPFQVSQIHAPLTIKTLRQNELSMWPQ